MENSKNRFNYFTNQLDHVNDVLTDNSYSQLQDAINPIGDNKKMIVVDHNNKHFWLSSIELKPSIAQLGALRFGEKLHFESTIEGY